MTAAATWQIGPMVWVVLAVQAVGIIGSIAVVKHIAKGADRHMQNAKLHVSENNGYVAKPLCEARFEQLRGLIERGESRQERIEAKQDRMLALMVEDRD